MSLGEKRSKRLAKELRMLQNSKEDYIKDVKIIESDMDHWVVSFEDSCLPEHLACLDWMSTSTSQKDIHFALLKLGYQIVIILIFLKLASFVFRY